MGHFEISLLNAVRGAENVGMPDDVQRPSAETALRAYEEFGNIGEVTTVRCERCGDVLPHEFLSIMLGVRRPSVTEVLAPLQKRGVISNGRGVIEVLDRAELKSLACECYRAVTQEYARLFGE